MPINDLSVLSKSGADRRALLPGQQNDVAIAGGQILGDEYSDHVVKTRSGIILREGCVYLSFVPLFPSDSLILRDRTLLKSDRWLSRSSNVSHGVRGAINFRNIPGTNIYALGQPTLEAVDEVVRRVHEAHPEATRIVWITLREEPLVYVNGAPYCLRRERFSLRNMKGQHRHSRLRTIHLLKSEEDYGGISSSRLEVLEERLCDDVVSEVHAFGGRSVPLLSPCARAR